LTNTGPETGQQQKRQTQRFPENRAKLRRQQTIQGFQGGVYDHSFSVLSLFWLWTKRK
jgi:hypothetical protein